MSLKANIRVGKNCTISLDAATPVDLIKEASQFTQLPRKCGHCDSEDLHFSHRKAGDSGEYDYLHLKCASCGAQADIGQYKKPEGGIYFKFQPKNANKQPYQDTKDGFYKYWEQPGYQSGGGRSQTAAAPEEDYGPGATDDGDEIPF